MCSCKHTPAMDTKESAHGMKENFAKLKRMIKATLNRMRYSQSHQNHVKRERNAQPGNVLQECNTKLVEPQEWRSADWSKTKDMKQMQIEEDKS